MYFQVVILPFKWIIHAVQITRSNFAVQTMCSLCRSIKRNRKPTRLRSVRVRIDNKHQPITSMSTNAHMVWVWQQQQHTAQMCDDTVMTKFRKFRWKCFFFSLYTPPIFNYIPFFLFFSFDLLSAVHLHSLLYFQIAVHLHTIPHSFTQHLLHYFLLTVQWFQCCFNLEIWLVIIITEIAFKLITRWDNCRCFESYVVFFLLVYL